MHDSKEYKALLELYIISLPVPDRKASNDAKLFSYLCSQNPAIVGECENPEMQAAYTACIWCIFAPLMARSIDIDFRFAQQITWGLGSLKSTFMQICHGQEVS